VAAQQKSRLTSRLPDRILPVARTSSVASQDCLTNRIAVYGPVRTVVWEGIRRKADPYSDTLAVATVVATN
jgi:hypothetical protein